MRMRKTFPSAMQCNALNGDGNTTLTTLFNTSNHHIIHNYRSISYILTKPNLRCCFDNNCQMNLVDLFDRMMMTLLLLYCVVYN